MTDYNYTPATVRQVRDNFLKTADKVHIKKGGDVHVLGTMPNTNQRGWYFAGMIENLQDELGYEMWMSQPMEAQ